jgi:hypothetical protein
MTTLKEKGGSGPVEVWLTKKNIEVTCMIVFEDETTSRHDIDSVSMRGAQRETTSWLINWGYEAAGRWQAEALDDDQDVIESVRHFRPSKKEVVDSAH